MSTLFFNARIVNEGRSFIGYVGIRYNYIDLVGEGEPDEDYFRQYTYAKDLRGALLMPGVIDDQVHFRDPGLTHKADIESESRAALVGGVTSFMDMPNTKPPTVTQVALAAKHKTAAEKSYVNYSFFLGATNDNIETLRSADFSIIPGVKVFLGSSTGNMLVDKEKALDDIFSLGRLVAVHSEDEQIIRSNIGLALKKYGEDVPVDMHPVIRNHQACIAATEKAIARAQRLGTRLHILHLSTAEEARMLADSPLKDKKITGEVCVHHLWFTDADYAAKGALIKCNPAVKTEADREELRQAVRDGRIDIVATDHAPHLLSEKEGGALQAASGLPIVQFSLPLMLRMADEGVFSFEKVVEMMCNRPAELYGIDRRGYIRPGYFADIVICRRIPFMVTPEIIESKCGWSPLEGEEFPWSIESVYVNGSEAFRRNADDTVDFLPHPVFPLKYNA